MFQSLLSLLFLATIVVPASCQGGNYCTQYKECGLCIAGGGDCSWCPEEDFLKLYPSRSRCDEQANIKDLCQNLVSPASSQKVPGEGDKPLDSNVQVSPQIVDLTLRPGQAAKFELKVRSAENYPADLYFLMDCTNSMRDDLDNFMKLDLAGGLRKITNKFQLGFGAFADKTLSPFIDRVTFRSCQFDPSCTPPYAYQNVLKLTSNEDAFKEVLKNQKVSGNNDIPENSFDGLMQIAVCEKDIGWQPLDTSRRIVVVMTDAPYHISGDGKLGGLVVPNDGQCHLDAKRYYSMGNTLDYPSVSFMKKKLKDSKIVPVLAVTAPQKDSYQALAEEWKEIGAVFGTLNSDSSNIVELVEEAYNKIASTVRLIDDSPSNVKVEYKPADCPSGNGNECNNVKIGSTVTFEVSVTATSCSGKAQDNFRIGIAGFGDVQIRAKYVCSCACEDKSLMVPKSPKCNGNGTYTCGACYCDAGSFGDTCKCDSGSNLDDSSCIPPNNTNLPACYGRGRCNCGKCICDSSSFSGKYCECSTRNCPVYNNEVCGGPSRGDCNCNRCTCKGIWQGENCGEKNCAKAQVECLNEGVNCSNAGVCNCGTCECKEGRAGKYCEKCPACPGVCEKNLDCILCQAFNEGSDEKCKLCKLNVKVVNGTMKDANCNIRDNKECLVRYKYFEDKNGNFSFMVQKDRQCPIRVVYKPNILAIVLGTIGGILLAGLVALLLWKLLISAYDRYEYNKFQKETAKAQWERTENPLYIPSKQKFDNPLYAGSSKPSS